MRFSCTYLISLLPLVASATSLSCNETLPPETKQLTTTDGTSYVYDYLPASDDKPTVLFLHGFPGTRKDWKHQVRDLSAEGYGIMAPDLLGYGETDRPTDLAAYRLKRMSHHLSEMLDNEGIQTVVGVGHDWGTVVLSRSLYWHAERYDKVAFVSTGYTPVGTFWDVDAFNVASFEEHGYYQYGYWYFFNSYNAKDLIADHLDSAFSLIFHRNASAWPENFSNIGAARAFLTANKTTPRPDWISAEEKQAWMETFGTREALEAGLNCYQSLMRGTQAEDEENQPDEGKMLRVPVLSIGGRNDFVARADQLHASFDGWATAGHEARDLDTGHWVMYEDPDGVSSNLLEFLKL